ncbi:MAG: A/G-specific adenine glycosylase [Pseudomonadota bacterium]
MHYLQPAFAKSVLKWFEISGRKHLPWQNPRTPYRVWISEVMLQQTQVATVINYFDKFIAAFPTIKKLAAADQDSVLHLWSGLGYYSRGRNLHCTAQRLVENHGSKLPDKFEALIELPGIGRSTAGAILSLGHNKFGVILDANVKRVLCRYFGVVGWPGDTSISKILWQLATDHTPHEHTAFYNQAMMDLGALICTPKNPQCMQCPLQKNCTAFQEQKISHFPQKRVTNTKPVRQSIWLVLQTDNNHVLLSQKPSNGLWGGLWCFPEFSNEKELNLFLSQIKNKIFQKKYKQSFRHTFSHFHLDVAPIFINVRSQIHQSVQENLLNTETSISHQWVNLFSIPNLGLAAPVKKILNSLKSSV